MTIAAYLVNFLTIAAVLVVVIRTAPRRRSIVGRTVVVNTKLPDDQSIRGVLVAEHADRLTLREAFVVTPNGDQAIAGLAHVPRSSVAWIQEIQV